MTISKEQWTEIERELRRNYCQCRFRVDGREILVRREGYSEGRTCLVVYIDGSWSFGYGSPSSELYLPITVNVWRKRSQATYKPSQKAELVKICKGVKRARESFPSLDDVRVWYEPIFHKAGTLVRQFRRITDIELIAIGHQLRAAS